jgi:hypothetical protein
MGGGGEWRSAATAGSRPGLRGDPGYIQLDRRSESANKVSWESERPTGLEIYSTWASKPSLTSVWAAGQRRGENRRRFTPRTLHSMPINHEETDEVRTRLEEPTQWPPQATGHGPHGRSCNPKTRTIIWPRTNSKRPSPSLFSF